jgi:hypothetical protein
MLSIIDPVVLSPAASVARATQPMRDALARIESVVAPLTGLAESFRRMGESVPTIQWDFAAPQMQSDREREPAAPLAPVAGSQVAPSAPAPSRKQNRGNRTTRPGTVAAAVALGFYLRDRRYNPKLTPSALALLAADFAEEQGLKGADLLDPRGSTMRTLAAGFLAGWKTMAKVAAQNPKVAAH